MLLGSGQAVVPAVGSPAAVGDEVPPVGQAAGVGPLQDGVTVTRVTTVAVAARAASVLLGRGRLGMLLTLPGQPGFRHTIPSVGGPSRDRLGASTPAPDMQLVSLGCVNADAALNATTRSRDIARLAQSSPGQPLDVLVVGGGVVGAGALLDAVQRGMDAVLVERDDLASGTSSRSSRLAHGGLRYLEQMEFGLVHEALTERGLLLDRLAPHLVRPVPFIFPVAGAWERSKAGAGVALYDMLSRMGAYGGTMPRPRALSKVAALGIAPGLNPDAFHSAVRFHDAQIDDARHTLAVARTAVGLGGGVVTGARVVELLRGTATDQPETAGGSGRTVIGARLEVDGQSVRAYARVVLVAAGPWTDEVLALAAPNRPPVLRPSKGTHLVVDRDAFVSTSALIARTASSVLFALPWGRRWLIGTTDTDFEGDPGAVAADEQDAEYLLAEANRWFSRPLTRADIRGVYSGVRPLVTQEETDPTSTLSREHVVMRPVPGLVAIASGKYTTYRVMAKDAVDAVAELLPREVAQCRTHELPLLGAADYAAMWAGREEISRSSGLATDLVEALLRRHGDRVVDVLEVLALDPRLSERMDPEGACLLAEAVVAVTHEGARSLTDILVRRTRTAMEVGDGGARAADAVAEVLQDICGWDAEDLADQKQDLADYPNTLPGAKT